MKTFTSDKKVPAISLLLFNGAFVTDLQEKANVFNSFFYAERGSVVSHNSVLHSKLTYI